MDIPFTKKEIIDSIMDYIRDEGWLDDPILSEKPYYILRLPDTSEFEFGVSLEESEMLQILRDYPDIVFMIERKID